MSSVDYSVSDKNIGDFYVTSLTVRVRSATGTTSRCGSSKYLHILVSCPHYTADSCVGVNCNNGDCEALSETQTTCNCNPGWYGTACEDGK